MIEKWRDIPGWKGHYQASDLGRVRSVDKYVRRVSKAGREFWAFFPGRVLRPGKCKGYLIVHLSGYGTIGVHILVMRAFSPRLGKEVNHKNGVKRDCRYKNLEWSTRVGNLTHAVTLGLNSQAIKVIGYPLRQKNKIIKAPSQAEAAFRLTGQRKRGSEISRVLRGGRSYALGYMWVAA